ncbi:dolichyl-diphosphooligosaccharide-protein glycosyltransferase [Dichomitus squalens]|uniref:Dolichyl-diphosphooligosaccharide--protein glycosyltransferase subunit WBP1 n=1 Tax=Dichomitus squalens TaxID=114155 RepID=A0A4Q9NIJ6_9APHY|nr:dolichyl-diphosphooligosaccharide-protein glycosyltransferase [Dichomitus squalens]TBU41080.1 dolichyl-diphosphooligosaccharide-protein glycosyltransferase [Dichomitus squalens]TBU55225.1 dolichyl-diphosphooligosaccharide-protein glycosyltransferase [Dichomitus squalens]
MRFLRTLLFPLVALTSLALARSSTGDTVLVLLEPSLKKENFSIFFGDLEKKGYKLTFRSPKDTTPEIIKDDVAQFAHVVVFAPETKTFAGDITPQTLVSLLSKKTNLLLALSPKQTPLSSLAAEFTLILPPPGTPLISHFPKRDTPATVVPVEPPRAHHIISDGLAPVWFSGVPQALGNSPMLVPLLQAPPQAFASDADSDSGADALVEAAEKSGEGLWAGSSLSLVTGFQALSNARATWVGGIEIFSDEYINKEISKGVKSGNRQFVKDVAAWTFQEANVLRIDTVEHHRVNETLPRETYTINNQVTYTAYISQYDPELDLWEPYSGINDLQLEFTMLDPHIRTSLPPVAGEPGKYSVSFRVPDRHGVFKFNVDYKRKGWSYLSSTTVVPIVPPRHDEYPRFLSAAWPYYAGAFSTSAAFLLFVALWLAGDEREPKKGKGSKAE